MFIWKSLEQQLEEEIAEDLMKKNMKAEKVEVLIEGENVKAVLYLQSEPDQELERSFLYNSNIRNSEKEG